MEITKVSYERIFPLAPYVNEKVGFEATIDGSAESEKEALTKLKQIAEEWHKANSPELYASNGQVILDNSIPPGPPPIIQVTQGDRNVGVTVDSITSCKDLTTLHTYKFIVRGCSKEIREAYQTREEELIGNYESLDDNK